jgi:tripartite-type tricarboxylate transporter receptor subunit TctC
VLPDVKLKLDALGFESEPNTPDEFAAYLKAEIAKWKRVIIAAKIKQI